MSIDIQTHYDENVQQPIMKLVSFIELKAKCVSIIGGTKCQEAIVDALEYL